MIPGDLIVIPIIILVISGAILSLVRGRHSCGCSGGCKSCCNGCNRCVVIEEEVSDSKGSE